MSEHSRLGGSGAERWMNCPGSVSLLNHLALPPEGDEPDYRAEGTACHEAAAYCIQGGLDAWEAVGAEFHGITVTPDMGKAIQVYLDAVVPLQGTAKAWGCEERVCFPEHPLGFGTVDHWALAAEGTFLDITDYKNGFLLVEVEANPQFMYYAFALLHDPRLAGVRRVRLRVVQPNGFHPEGPVRTWVTSADEIMDWGNRVLVPAMLRAELDTELLAGSWCRFCPAKLVCPMLSGLFEAACKIDPKTVVDLSDASLGRDWQQISALKFFIKALEEETLKRKMAGKEVPGVKLVMKRADRVWKEGAEAVIAARLGEKAYIPPEFVGPAQAEKAGGAEIMPVVKEWAYTPQAGYTIAPASSKSPEVTVPKASAVFQEVAANVDQ